MANYGVDIELSVKGLSSLRQLERQITSVEEAARKVRTIDVSGATKESVSVLEAERRALQLSGKERRQNLILANREVQTEKKINAILERRIQLEETRRKASERFESVALGVGFPLLFGGGLGAVGGGLAGYFLGKGFGGQILLSALGQQLDAFTADVAELGQALNPLTADVDKIIEKTGLVGTKTAAYIKELEDAERSALALELATAELAVVVGGQGVDALKNFGGEAQRFQNEWSAAMTQMGAALAEFLGPAIKAATNMLQNANAVRAAAQSSDVQLQQLTRDYEKARTTGILFGGGPEEEQKILDKIKVRLEEIRKVERERVELKADLADLADKYLDSLEKTTKLLEKTGKELDRLIQDTSEQQVNAYNALSLKQLEYDLVVETNAKEKISLKFAIEREKLVQAYNTAMDRSLSVLEDQLLTEEFRLDREILKRKEAEAYTEELRRQNAEFYRRAGLKTPDLFREFSSPVDIGLAFSGKSLLGEDERLEEAKKQLEKLLDPINQVQTAAEGISGAFTNSFSELIKGSMSAQEALANFFRRVSDTFLDMAAQIITKMVVIKALESAISIFGGGGGLFKGAGPVQYPSDLNIGSSGFGIGGSLMGRARGGAVSANTPYIVGERGPELFVPGANGNIVPNNAMGGVQVGSINITVENTGDQLSPAAQKQIANQVQGIVMSTLVNERRSGGVLR